MKVTTDFKGRDFLSLADYRQEELTVFLDTADALKKEQKSGVGTQYLPGRTLGMIFSKSSTRTRISFETGIYQLGGHGLFLSGNDLQMGRGEPIKDTARVLSRYLDGIMIRTFSHEEVESLADYASIPVINGLTDALHPCQVLADLQTIREIKGRLEGIKIAYIGDGNNMAHSLMNGAAKMGMILDLACPKGYWPDSKITEKAMAEAKKNGASIRIVEDPFVAAENADVFYTDVWASMGQEAEAEKRKQVFSGIYQVNDALLRRGRSPIVLHCLPAHRGEEITDEVMEAHKDEIIEEAENRLHAQKAVMSLLIP